MKGPKMVDKVLFSSKSTEWGAPKALFDSLNKEFGFTCDVCATADNAKCVNYFSKEEDGLSQDWEGVCFMNPPYGKEIGKWVRKAYESGKDGTIVVCLVPARTDTKWFQDYCLKGEVRFIRGRLTFEGAKNPAPFPSAIVIFPKEVSLF